MKPKLIEWIPIYGMFKYFKRYFNAEKRNGREILNANYFEMYHLFVGGILLMWLLSYFFKF